MGTVNRERRMVTHIGEAFRITSLAVLLGLAPAPAPVLAQARAGASWVEAGGFWDHVTNDFGSWKGGYARAVLSEPATSGTWTLECRRPFAIPGCTARSPTCTSSRTASTPWRASGAAPAITCFPISGPTPRSM